MDSLDGQNRAIVIAEPRKRGFSKGGFCRVQCHGQGNKKFPRILAQQYIGHLERHSQERRTSLQKPPSKKPLFLVPDSYRRITSESYGRDSNHWRSLAVISPPPNKEIGPHRPCVRCAAFRVARLAFIHATFVPHGTAEWPARVDCIR